MMNCARPRAVVLILLQLGWLVGCGSDSDGGSRQSIGPGASDRGASAARSSWPRAQLRAEKIWQLNLPNGQRFDASGLAFTPEGDLLTLSDRGPEIYKIKFRQNTNAADLVLIPTCFNSQQLKPYAREKIDRYDSEGIAVDAKGTIYVCEEANRWILRCDPGQGKVERLPIDWRPVQKYFDLSDLNASFEGVAVSPDKLYVANERQVGRIIVVDLATLKIVDDFSVHPAGSNARDIHYSDLCWFDGVLYALLRESRCVVAIQPADHRVIAEYDFKEMEREPEVLYRSLYPTSQMEGLAVDKDYIWLCTDNNGTGRAKYPHDIRPTLFKCRKPVFGP
jgi:uncharacterized protein YjiK